jgi:predicted lipoprotein with Yx(FWY)xxD motif
VPRLDVRGITGPATDSSGWDLEASGGVVLLQVPENRGFVGLRMCRQYAPTDTQQLLEYPMALPRLIAALVTAVFLVAGCTSGTASPAPSSGGASGAAGVTVGTSSSSLGTYLTGPNGMALYTQAGDSATSSTCTGGCASAWPPLATTGQPTAGSGVTGQLGTLTRADGTTQVTYGGLPLYYWQGDAKAGDVTGNGVNGFSLATVGGAGSLPSASGAAPAASSSATSGY